MCLISGEMLSMPLTHLLRTQVMEKCKIWNLYGPAETTIDCTFHLVDTTLHKYYIPIGRPLPGYQCLVVDQFFQLVAVDQEGELLIGGIGVFAGYLHRQDLTANALINIDNQLFYRTGDLARFDNNGQLYFVGRKDFQIKLRGQRIELGEIERCILDLSSQIFACVVMKLGDHHLIAYVQSPNITQDQLREHCRSRLPSFMIPSIFILLEEFPLNSNGKLDRKRLPQPEMTLLPSLTDQEYEHVEPKNEFQTRIHSLWCELFQCNRISTQANFFSIGGHSLLLIQLYHRYKGMFNLDSRTVNITQFFENPSIFNHARLLAKTENIEGPLDISWKPLHIVEGKRIVKCKEQHIFER